MESLAKCLSHEYDNLHLDLQCSYNHQIEWLWHWRVGDRWIPGVAVNSRFSREILSQKVKVKQLPKMSSVKTSPNRYINNTIKDSEIISEEGSGRL